MSNVYGYPRIKFYTNDGTALALEDESIPSDVDDMLDALNVYAKEEQFKDIGVD